MIKRTTLNRIEHRLLSMHVDDIEPLFVLYSDTIKYMPNITLHQILNALIKLLEMGFSECMVNKDGKWQECQNITIKDLEERFKGDKFSNNFIYDPVYANDYYFRITSKGRLEERKKIYDSYYLE